MRKKLSEELLCDLWFYLTELQIYPQEAAHKVCSCGICRVIFGSPWRAMMKKKICSDKTGNKVSEKLFCVLLIHLTGLQLSPQKPFAETVLVEFAKWYLEAHRGLWWKRIYLQIKIPKQLSETLLCDIWIPLTELQLYSVELLASLFSVLSENCYFGSLWRL